MIIAKEKKNTDHDENTFEVYLFADSKSEVVPGATIIGLPKNAGIEPGSRCMTADGDFAYMKSDGNWNWI